MAITTQSHPGQRRRLRAETTESWLIFGLSFPVCLAAAAIGRAARRRSHLAAPDGEQPSIFAEARAAASTCSSFAFMG
jgi:hypothetical protein